MKFRKKTCSIFGKYAISVYFADFHTGFEETAFGAAFPEALRRPTGRRKIPDIEITPDDTSNHDAVRGYLFLLSGSIIGEPHFPEFHSMASDPPDPVI